ncbi:MAG: pilus assembly protein PilM [Desulfohalobiaceae bacterium]|nr:pilus assembly protein PilM [Desulfohalobiaceae bacterium]
MLNQGQTYPIGLDLGPDDLFAVQLERAGRGLRIREAMHRHLDADTDGDPLSDSSLPGFLKKLRQKANFRGKRVVLRLDSSQVFSFPLQFQAERDEDPEQAILRQSENHIPYALEDAVLDYSCLQALDSKNPTGYACTVVASRREYICRCLSLMKEAGLDVRVIEYGAPSLIRLHDHLLGMPREPAILCYLGRKQTLIGFASRDRIYAERHLPWGVDRCLDKLKRNLVQDDARARWLLGSYGLKYGLRTELEPAEMERLDRDTLRAVYQIIISPLEELVHEFNRLFAYIRSEERQVRFEGTMLYGHLQVIQGLESYLAGRINLPVQEMAPAAHFKTGPKCRLPEAEIDSGFALALGLSLRRVPWL